MDALIALAQLLIILASLIYVARRVARYYREQNRPPLVAWFIGGMAGAFVAMGVTVLLAGFRTNGPAGSEMLASGLSILAMSCLVFWLIRKEKKTEQGEERTVWLDRMTRPLLEAWNTAEREVEKKNREKAKRREAEFSLASFSYVDVEGEWTERTVTNLSAYRDGGRQYVQGYCLDRGDVRTFRLDRIKGAIRVQPGGKQFSPAEFYGKLPHPGRGR